MGFYGIDKYLKEKKSLLLITSITLMIFTSYYYSIPGIIVIYILGLFTGYGRSIYSISFVNIIRNISENSTYVKGKFGNSISMVSDDFLEKTNGLATFTRDSFTPAVDLMKDYEEYLEIVQNYDENIYKNKLTKLEEGNLNAMRQRVDTIAVDGGGSNNYFEIEDHMISETPMTLEDYVESLKTLKNAIEQLGEHNIVAMPVGDGPAEINLDSNVDEGEEITF